VARTMKEIEATAYDLKRIREGFKMSQTQFAEFLHTTQATISRWETERAIPPIVKLYLDLYQKGQKAPTNRKQKKAKRVAVRAKLGALTPAERVELDAIKESVDVATNAKA
jgi:transcriptional regulator with XRE-family HTH domain